MSLIGSLQKSVNDTLILSMCEPVVNGISIIGSSFALTVLAVQVSTSAEACEGDTAFSVSSSAI